DAVHGTREDRVDLVFLARNGEAHMQKVRRVAKLVARIDEGLADRVFVGHGGDRRHLGDHADGCHLALLGILDVDRVVIEGRERPYHADHDGHGMRVAAEPGVEPRHLLVHHRVLHDAVVERAILLTAGKFAVKQQVAGLDEVAVLGKLVDRVSAIEQDALVAVAKRDLRLAARGRGEARVVGKAAGVLIERVDVDDGGAHRALADGQLVSRAVDKDRCLGGVRRAEVFCDAHLKAPLRSWEAGRYRTLGYTNRCGANELVLHCRTYSSCFSRSATCGLAPKLSNVLHCTRSRIRARDSSRPSISSTSQMPGDVDLPVRAARSGCATLPSFRPVSPAKARTSASSASGFQEGRASRRGRRVESVSRPAASTSLLAWSSSSRGRLAKRESALSSSSTRVLSRCL